MRNRRPLPLTDPLLNTFPYEWFPASSGLALARPSYGTQAGGVVELAQTSTLAGKPQMGLSNVPLTRPVENVASNEPVALDDEIELIVMVPLVAAVAKLCLQVASYLANKAPTPRKFPAESRVVVLLIV